MANLWLAATSGSNVVDLITGLAWPVVVIVVVWRLLPSIREVVRSRAFTVKAGGMEISVQEASKQLYTQIDDLRQHVVALSASSSTATEEDRSQGAPPAAAGPAIRRILWVDDFPENNAYELEALKRSSIEVDQARSTAEALGLLAQENHFGAIVTDMGRVDDGPEAGLDLLKDLRDKSVTTPVIVYASAPAVARTRERAKALGAAAVTASATELFTLLAALGLQ